MREGKILKRYEDDPLVRVAIATSASEARCGPVRDRPTKGVILVPLQNVSLSQCILMQKLANFLTPL